MGMTSNSPYPKKLSKTAFIERFGSIYEHANWVAQRAYEQGVQPGITSNNLSQQMALIVDSANDVDQLELLRAHPDLAGKLAISDLSVASQNEQHGAGLDQCTPQEFEEFQHLNEAYAERFGFPFIFAVAGFQKSDILRAFRQRIHNNNEQEKLTALEQVHKIAANRLQQLGESQNE